MLAKSRHCSPVFLWVVGARNILRVGAIPRALGPTSSGERATGWLRRPFSPVKSLDPQDGPAYVLSEMDLVSASGCNKVTGSLRCRLCIVLTAGRAKAGPSSW
jgi:hypothetical protein